MRSKIILAASLLLSALSAHASPILTNGSFEDGFSGWTVNAGSTYATSVSSGGYHAQDGSYFAALGNQNTLGTISQTFTDVAGQHYTLSFYLASNGTMANEFRADINGATLFDQVNIPTQDYILYTYDFIGTGSDTLTFYERNDPNYLALDNISVVDPTVAATPEPSSLALLGTGLVGIAGLVRRRIANL